ncbi:hypothetical protein QYM36_015726 [Artemia franciscana]|uniref:Uncharacterized protein n=1 Tax=Artemia franciscana TaxID=6661 RepID=A0AA88HAW2_ARTSF|nr:hypothetical protein QYM36_015726 [Artemia franciscana]
MRDNYDVNYSLICAVRQGDLERTKELINSFGLSYSKGWSQGYILLRDALFNRKIEIAKLLLIYGCKVYSINIKPSVTPLHLAVASSGTEVVKMILYKGARINAVNKRGETPLHCAIKNSDKNIEIIILLLKHGSNVNVRTNYGESPLHLAASKGCPQTVDYLLMHGADVNAINNDGESPLHLAAFGGFSQIFDYLLKYGAHVDCVYACSWRKGYTPLHCAASEGSTEAVQLLLDNGANVDAKGENSCTPLHIAVLRGKESIVEILLQYGAKVDNQDKNGKTALRLAVENGSLQTIQNILKYSPDINNPSNRESLKIAVLCKFKEVVEALVEYGFGINPEDINFTELLQSAVEKGYVKIVEDFLNYGAKVNTALRHCGLNLLHIAVINKQEEVADLLISNEADINARDIYGRTPIFYAAKNADLNLTKFLLSNKAIVKDSPEVLLKAVETKCIEIVKVLLRYIDVNATDEDGQTALHLLLLEDAAFGNVETYTMLLNLLRYDIDINATNRFGQAALHLICFPDKIDAFGNLKIPTRLLNNIKYDITAQNYHGKIVKLLLECGARVNSQDNFGKTALHYVNYDYYHSTRKYDFASYIRRYTIKLLLKYGARVNSQDKDGRTALHYACDNKCDESVQELLEHGSDINIMSKDGRTAFDCSLSSIGNYMFRFHGTTFELIACHLVKMKAANLYLSKENIRIVYFISKVHTSSDHNVNINFTVTSLPYTKVYCVQQSSQYGVP